MSVTVNAVGSEAYQNAVTTKDYTGLTVAAGSNSALVLTLNFGSGSVSSVTAVWDHGGSAQSMTQLILRQIAGTTSVLFGLRAPTTGNKTLRVSWTTSAEVYVAAVAFDGVNQTSDAAAFPNTAGATNGGGGLHTVDLTSATGNMVVGCQGGGANPGTPTGTQIYADVQAAIFAQAEYDSGAATVAVGATGGNCNVVVAVDVAASAGGGGISIPVVAHHRKQQGMS